MMNSPTRDKPRCNVATRSSVRSSAIVGESRLPISSSRMCFTEITRRLIYSFYFDIGMISFIVVDKNDIRIPICFVA